MAKKSVVERNNKRVALVKRHAARRQELKDIINNRTTPTEERFMACVKLAALPRNSSKTRVHNRCALTGRGRSYYRKMGISRIKMRELASFGKIPGMVKSSW